MMIWNLLFFGTFQTGLILPNKKLCYREEHSASVLFRWSTLSHLQSTGVSLCGLTVKKRFHQPQTRVRVTIGRCGR